MTQSIGEELAARLETVELSDEAGALVLAACEGDAALADLVGGTRAQPSSQPSVEAHVDEAEMGVFLKSISVEGFRGIGPAVALTLQPGPGLTLVVGRNGSGKSSFAEALELLLTGSNQRWAHRSMAWREDWRNLHHTERTAITADFTLEGHAPTTVARQWPPGQGVGDGEATAQHKSEARGPFSRLGWETGLSLYRPFLSYNELGSILDDGPSKLFDAIARVLGVDDLVVVADRLNAAHKQVSDLGKTAKAAALSLTGRLTAIDDSRASTAVDALGKRGGADLEAIQDLLEGEDAGESAAEDLAELRRRASLAGPDLAAVGIAAAELRQAADAVDSVAGTDAGAARELAVLLGAAIAHHRTHGDVDCPVCGRASALDATWQERAEARVTELGAAATTADTAHRRLAQAIHAGQAVVSATPIVVGPGEAQVASEAWAELGSSELAPTALADALEERALALDGPLAILREEAAVELARREDLWRPVALDLAAWLATARQVRAASEMSKPLRDAYDWVQSAAADARRERFAPIAEKAKKIWDLLRQQSNVELGEIVLAGTKTNRRVVLDVKVDGVTGAALGVMSQGELHALALSLFLPRATMDASPFRFVVIDDPVQSMDPARVDGLARVLEEVATTRQVVVFTHDDRLSEAVRRLQVPARILEVTRRVNSVIEVRNALDPTERALDDARALVRTKGLPGELASHVVPGFCRLAVEARCADVVRRRRLGRGDTHSSVEDTLAAAHRLGARVSLALFDHAGASHEQIDGRLGRFGSLSVKAFFRCIHGAHDDGDLDELVHQVEVLVGDLGGLA